MNKKPVPKDFLIRTNEVLFEKVAKEAKSTNRSINAMINQILMERYEHTKEK